MPSGGARRPAVIQAGRPAFRRQNTEVIKHYVPMSEAEMEEAVEAMASLIVRLVKSKGRKMRSGRNRPAMRPVLEARRPQDELPGPYEPLGALMRKRGEVESEIQALEANDDRPKDGRELLQRLEGELGRIKEDIAGIDGEIKAIERRRRIRKPEEVTE